MHTEFIEVGREFVLDLRATLQASRPVIAVGTTSARTLETLYWLGLKVSRSPGLPAEELVVRQWDAYATNGDGAGSNGAGNDATNGHAVDAITALSILLQWMERQGIDRVITTTQLLITPGYRWKIVAGLVTNFHQPESTLLLLIASFIGEDWRKVYDYALEHGFRFLSYGDGCLLLPQNPPAT